MNHCVAVYRPVENGTDFKFVDFNRTAELTEQISKEELIGKKVTEVFPSVEEFGLLDIMKKVAQTGEMEKHPISQYIDDRISGWRENYVYKLPTGEILVIYRDITKQKQDEETLASQLKLLQMAGESAKFGGWSVDLEKNICTWSDQVTDIHKMPHGFSPPIEEGINFYAPEWREKITQVFTDCVQKGIPYDEEMQIITSQGERVWVRTVGEAVRDEDGKIVRVQGSFQDISARKIAQESLHEEREQLLALFNSIEQAIYVTDPDSYEILFVNKYLRNLFDEDPIGGICYQVFQGLDEPCPFCTNEIIFEEIGKPYTWEFHNDLLKRDFLITDKAIRWVDDRDVRFEIAIDITKQKQAEKEILKREKSLEKQRTTLNAVLNAPQDTVALLDRDGTLVNINQNGAKRLGKRINEVIGKNIFEIFPTPLANQRKIIIDQVFENGQEAHFEDSRAGIYLDNSIYPIFSKDGETVERVAIYATDITKRKQSEKELRELKEKLEIQVAEKTKQLQARIKDLERFHDATIEREMRMKELRDEIKRLKGEKDA